MRWHKHDWEYSEYKCAGTSRDMLRFVDRHCKICGVSETIDKEQRLHNRCALVVFIITILLTSAKW